MGSQIGCEVRLNLKTHAALHCRTKTQPISHVVLDLRIPRITSGAHPPHQRDKEAMALVASRSEAEEHQAPNLQLTVHCEESKSFW